MKNDKNYLKLAILVITAFCISFYQLSAQVKKNLVGVNKDGRMVWKSTGKEAFFWGVNYTSPFAHAYRQIERAGENRERSIDNDIYHLSRLGINAYRIHVWDCEISDSLGNLLDNDHLRLLDYTIFRLQQRGIYTFLTPIAYWGNGYPEPNEELPGFSGRFNKGNVYILPEAIEAQANYLKQFISHVNPYNGKSYKDDPMIIGFEICNEPGHSKAAETTTFVNRMIKEIRSSGCSKPLFYNVTQSINLLEDFIKGGTDGVTFQWYPTGLVAGAEAKGNYLPHVDIYDMPFKNEKYFRDQARLVYEFDAADVGRSYLYPPIALSFKEAGMQWVTMFAYEPAAIAASNTEYQTHFLNLAYSPAKAIGFKIAAEIFKDPQYKRDRLNEKFPFEMIGFRSEYEEDISELVTSALFYYTNNTSTTPPDLKALRSVAGYGNSPVVSYNGYGAYFLDKISDGIWRLEVMPDAIWVRDPFSKATPTIENVVIKWNKNLMSVKLPDLGQKFQIKGINKGNSYQGTATDAGFLITPGAYILSVGKIDDFIMKSRIGFITADEFYAPEETNDRFYFLHNKPEEVFKGSDLELTLKIISPPEPVEKVVLQPSGAFQRADRRFRPMSLQFQKADDYTYKTTLPDSLLTAGSFNYTISVLYTSGRSVIYPGGVDGPAGSWQFYNPDLYTIKILPAGSELLLFSAEKSRNFITFTGDSRIRSSFVPSGVPGAARMTVNKSNVQERPNKSEVSFLLQNYVGDVLKYVDPKMAQYKNILIYASTVNKNITAEISLINKSGMAFSSKVILTTGEDCHVTSLGDLREGKLFLLPRPYPGFLPFWYKPHTLKPFSLSEIERIQFYIPAEGNEEFQGLDLSSITIK